VKDDRSAHGMDESHIKSGDQPVIELYPCLLLDGFYTVSDSQDVDLVSVLQSYPLNG
jgi:hypothetical protein